MKYNWLFAKVLKIEGKRVFYAYFKDEEALAKAITTSLEKEEPEGVWIIPQKKRGFEILILSPDMKNKVQAISDTKVDEPPTEYEVVDMVNKYR